MIKRQFYRLKRGDYVNGRRILRAHKIQGKTYFIVLKKIRPSRYNGDTTTYASCDALMFKRDKMQKCIKCRKHRKTQKGLCKACREREPKATK